MDGKSALHVPRAFLFTEYLCILMAPPIITKESITNPTYLTYLPLDSISWKIKHAQTHTRMHICVDVCLYIYKKARVIHRPIETLVIPFAHVNTSTIQHFSFIVLYRRGSPTSDRQKAGADKGQQ